MGSHATREKCTSVVSAIEKCRRSVSSGLLPTVLRLGWWTFSSQAREAHVRKLIEVDTPYGQLRSLSGQHLVPRMVFTPRITRERRHAGISSSSTNDGIICRRSQGSKPRLSPITSTRCSCPRIHAVTDGKPSPASTPSSPADTVSPRRFRIRNTDWLAGRGSKWFTSEETAGWYRGSQLRLHANRGNCRHQPSLKANKNLSQGAAQLGSCNSDNRGIQSPSKVSPTVIQVQRQASEISITINLAP